VTPSTSTTVQDPFEQYKEMTGTATPVGTSQSGNSQLLLNSEIKQRNSAILNQPDGSAYHNNQTGHHQTGSQRVRDKLLMNSGEMAIAQNINGS
jgi:hypothetical protein